MGAIVFGKHTVTYAYTDMAETNVSIAAAGGTKNDQLYNNSKKKWKTQQN